MYDSVVKKENAFKASCKVPSSLKNIIQTSVLHPLKKDPKQTKKNTKPPKQTNKIQQKHTIVHLIPKTKFAFLHSTYL